MPKPLLLKRVPLLLKPRLPPNPRPPLPPRPEPAPLLKPEPLLKPAPHRKHRHCRREPLPRKTGSSFRVLPTTTELPQRALQGLKTGGLRFGPIGFERLGQLAEVVFQ